jgi:hypothetical protein
MSVPFVRLGQILNVIEADKAQGGVNFHLPLDSLADFLIILQRGVALYIASPGFFLIYIHNKGVRL